MSELDKSFFIGNRERAYDQLEGGLLAVPAYKEMQRGNDASSHFEQEGNFWYLTGINNPDWLLLMDARHRRSFLVAPTMDPTHEVFNGSLSPDDARRLSGVDEIMDANEADEWMQKAANLNQPMHTIDNPPHADQFGFVLNPAAHETRAKLEGIFTSVGDFRLELAKMRAIKQMVEVAVMESAIDLTIKSFQDIRKNINKYQHEYQIEADFTHDFRNAGAEGHAYDPIVAFGKNACTLHYIRNSDKLNKNGMVLLDVGAKMGGYAADITRTYAVGEPTTRQRDVHAAVRLAQQQIIDLLKPGLLGSEYQKSVKDIMVDAMLSLSLIKDRNDTAFDKYFPHSIGHGLGIDVHDSLGDSKTFLPNMVVTVEPGIYIPEEGIGVRIEDDILITDTGHKNLSAGLSTEL